MLLAEAQVQIQQLCRIPFGRLFSPEQLDYIRINKGRAGQLLELALGIPLTNSGIDFDDGELKTNKCSLLGEPRETVFIMQISSIIDELLSQNNFEESGLFRKIRNILYVPVCKDNNDPEDWMFLSCHHIDLTSARYNQLTDLWRNDYYTICSQLKSHIENSPDGYIHTSNGTHIQVRSKDSQPYYPIFSQIYQRYVSNKNHAFYFQKRFVYDIKSLAL